ncbi:MAG: nuclear transport factor 2 family protein [Halioglobus sp.]|nr:nuclear transport factor 2 family protein [Halioglobus sp.]
MDIQERFFAYAAAFEESFVDDNWERLEQYFTDDAVYDDGMGPPSAGRAATIEKLKASVSGLDRRMDSRKVEMDPLTVKGDTLSFHWTARYVLSGAPDLEIGGTESARFEGDCIAHLKDDMDPGTVDAISEWLTAHADKLPAG